MTAKPFTPAELQRLAGVEFNRLLADDAELQRLEALKYDRAVEARLLLEVMGLGDLRVGKLPVRPLTAAKWAFLWILESPYVLSGAVRDSDLDITLFILSQLDLRKLSAALWEIPGLAAGYRAATGLSFEEAHREVQAIKNLAFRPLELLPPTNVSSSEPARFDAQWLTRITGIAATESGEPLERVMYEMSLAAVCCHYVNRAMRESAEPLSFGRRPDEELSLLISDRVDRLAREFLTKT